LPDNPNTIKHQPVHRLTKAGVDQDIIVFQTRRITVRQATPTDQDIDFYCSLWNNSEVMINVGFPDGLQISREKVEEHLSEPYKNNFDRSMVAFLTDSGELIGECKLNSPDDEGIASTDIKLFPQFWGKGYGTEIKRGLLNYLFEHTNCKAIEATPNKSNSVSQKMQEAVGGKRVGEDVYRFPEKMRHYTKDVHYYRYLVYREDWEKQNKDSSN